MSLPPLVYQISFLNLTLPHQSIFIKSSSFCWREHQQRTSLHTLLKSTSDQTGMEHLTGASTTWNYTAYTSQNNVIHGFLWTFSHGCMKSVCKATKMNQKTVLFFRHLPLGKQYLSKTLNNSSDITST